MNLPTHIHYYKGDEIMRHTVGLILGGGKGTRLMPLTETVPKPMLLISGRPILERIIESFTSQGFYRFTLSLNYTAETIRHAR